MVDKLIKRGYSKIDEDWVKKSFTVRWDSEKIEAIYYEDTDWETCLYDIKTFGE